MIRNLKVSSKLQGFLFAIIITCLVGCIGIMGMQQISQADQSLYEQQTRPLEYISNMIQSVQLICIEERNAIGYSRDPAKISEIEKRIDEYSSIFKDNQNKYLTILKVEEGINLVKGAEEVYDSTFFPNVKEVLKLASQGDTKNAQSVMEKGAEPVDEIIGTYNQCLKNSNREALIKSTANEELSTKLTAILALIIAMGVTVCIALCLAMVRAISKPMNELVLVSEQFAKGNLRAEIKYQSKNEIGRLADSLRFVFTSLQNIVNEISHTLEKISEKDISMDTLKAYTGDFAPVSQSVNTILDGLKDFFSMVQVSAEQVNSGSEQAAAMSEISQGVEQISAVIQMNSATSEESAAASEELSAQADMLKKELANFRLR